MPETALVAIEQIEIIPAADLFKPAVIDPILERIAVEVREQAKALDISTPNMRSQIAALAYKVGRSKTFIDGQRKTLVADEKKRLAKIDAEGKRIWDTLEALQSETRKPLTDWENANKARIAAHEANMAEIEQAGIATLQNWHTFPADAIRDRMKEIETPLVWEEFEHRANDVIAGALKRMAEGLRLREENDRQQEDLQRLRRESAEREQKERETRMVREATERAERDRLAAEERARVAEEQRKAQEERHAAQLKAQAEKAEADRLRAVKDEQERVERERNHQAYLADVRAKDAANRKNKNSDALAAFVKSGLSHEMAKLAVQAIVRGDIPCVRMEY